jgi:hypothetical protein
MTTVTTRFGDVITLTVDEARVLSEMQDLLRPKPAEFRQAVIAELNAEFCRLCGDWEPCYCGVNL